MNRNLARSLLSLTAAGALLGATGAVALADALPQAPLMDEVLALVRREEIKSPSGGLSSVSEVRLAPWATWPPVIQAPLLVLSDSWNVPFVSSVEPLGTFALGVEPFPKNNPSGCDLAAFYGDDRAGGHGRAAHDPAMMPGRLVALRLRDRGAHVARHRGRCRRHRRGRHERRQFVRNTRWWPPFCAAVDFLVAAILVVAIALGADFRT